MDIHPSQIKPPRQTRQASSRQPFDPFLLCQKLEALLLAEQTTRPQTHSPQPHYNAWTTANTHGALAAHKPASSPPAPIRKRSRPIITADGKPCVDPAYLEAVLSIHLTENSTRPNTTATHTVHRSRSALRPSTALDVSRREPNTSLGRIAENDQAAQTTHPRRNPRIRWSSCDLDASAPTDPIPDQSLRSGSAMQHHPPATRANASTTMSKSPPLPNQTFIRVTHGTQTHYEPAASEPSASQTADSSHLRPHNPHTKATKSRASPHSSAHDYTPDLFATSDEDNHAQTRVPEAQPTEKQPNPDPDSRSRPTLLSGRRPQDRPNWAQTSQHGDQFQGRLGLFFSPRHKSRAEGTEGKGEDADEEDEDVVAVREALRAGGRTVETGTLIADAVQRIREAEEKVREKVRPPRARMGGSMIGFLRRG